MNIIWYILIGIFWIAPIFWVIKDVRRRKMSVWFWGAATILFWLLPYALYLLSRLISELLLKVPAPVGFQIADRYLYREIIKMTIVTVLGIAFIILANNIYNSADMFAQKKVQAGEGVDIKTIALINLLDTPASVVLAFPVASLIGVMLALGLLAQGGEITAIRTGGISLLRLILPVLLLSIGFSYFNYFLSQNIVPWCAGLSAKMKTEYILGADADIERNALFKNGEMVIYAARYGTKNKDLNKVTVIAKDEQGLFHFWLSYQGAFKGDELLLSEVKEYICDKKGKLLSYEVVPRVTLPFPEDLQLVHEKKRDAFTLAAGDLATKIDRLEDSSIDATAAKIDQQFQISIPLACTIFSFVGFIFSIYNPRKEVSVGVLYAILIAFIYYVFMAIIRSLAKQDQEILRNPYVAAWLTNFVFFLFGVFLFTKVRR